MVIDKKNIMSANNANHGQYEAPKQSVTSIMPDGDVPNFDGLSADEAALVALGYKQEFKREFSLWTTFCVSFAVLGLLPSFASTLYYGMGYAGTGAMVWGWLVALVFIQCVAMGMAELCSSMPTRYDILPRQAARVDAFVAVVFIMPQPFLRLQVGVLWLPGSQDGRIGLAKSLELHQWTMACRP